MYCSGSTIGKVLVFLPLSLSTLENLKLIIFGTEKDWLVQLGGVQRSLEGCDGWVEGWGILYFKASVVQWRPNGIVSGNSSFFCFGKMNKKQRSCDCRGARAAPRLAF